MALEGATWDHARDAFDGNGRENTIMQKMIAVRCIQPLAYRPIGTPLLDTSETKRDNDQGVDNLWLNWPWFNAEIENWAVPDGIERGLGAVVISDTGEYHLETLRFASRMLICPGVDTKYGRSEESRMLCFTVSLPDWRGEPGKIMDPKRGPHKYVFIRITREEKAKLLEQGPGLGMASNPSPSATSSSLSTSRSCGEMTVSTG